MRVLLSNPMPRSLFAGDVGLTVSEIFLKDTPVDEIFKGTTLVATVYNSNTSVRGVNNKYILLLCLKPFVNL